MTRKRAVGVGARGGVDKILKRQGDVGNVGGLHKIRGLAPLCQLRKETFKNFPFP